MTMSASIRTIAVGFVLMISTVGHVEAQPSYVQVVDSAVTVESATDAIEPEMVAGLPAQGLPRRAPQPRTLHEYWPAFAVLAALWVAMVVFVFPMRSPLRRIAERIAASENRAGGR